MSTAIVEAHEQDGGLWQFRSVGYGQPQERHTTTLRVAGGRIEDEDGDGLDIYNPDTEWTRLFAVGKKARRQAERVAAARARDAAAQGARRCPEAPLRYIVSAADGNAHTIPSVLEGVPEVRVLRGAADGTVLVVLMQPADEHRIAQFLAQSGLALERDVQHQPLVPRGPRLRGTAMTLALLAAVANGQMVTK
jgi:hypothetical protein